MAEQNGGRQRDPHYDVFELRTLFEVTNDVDEDHEAEVGKKVDAWVILAQDVAAPSDKQAIATAADEAYGENDPRRYGQFWAPLAGTFKPRCRDRQLVPQEVWS